MQTKSSSRFINLSGFSHVTY